MIIKLGRISEETRGIKGDGPLDPSLIGGILDTP